ncbi:LysR family transcriptional regulator [Herbiconiux sp. SYSU D00978]|uniref:LysR family transcriptional regulator n=1 Tax=Herbiconiux sp. SYSU D00978 TaxID=2812562 RepID=UPI001A95EA37|nr:LysR family transcriptional regulator [Herbiconiux sp. SYSU D00978]
MDVRRLELLRELAERGSITDVARATNRTASAVSQQLKVLEREAGVPLTERHGRGIRLTGAGRALATTATEVAVAIEKAQSTWKEFTEQPQGTVTLTVFQTAGEMLLPGLLSELADAPGLSVRVSSVDPVLPDFADLTRDYDVVVADAPGILPSWNERGLVTVPLMKEPLDIALPENHRLAGKRTLSPSDLADETWIGVPIDFPYDRLLRQIEIAGGFSANISQRIGDNGIVESLVSAGHGIAILPRFTTRDRENGLVTRPISGVKTERQLTALVRPDRAVRPSVRLVVDALQRESQRFAAAHR